MARVDINWWSGVVLTLEHGEVDTAVQLAETGQDVAGFLKDILTGIPAVAFRVLELYFKLQARLIRSLDHGNGIYLTLPWPAIWWQQWWVIIPTPR
jgi:hypothetical protein